MKQDFEAYLIDLKARGPVWFYPNRGNAGDALILSATVQLLARLGIDFSLIDEGSFDAAGKVVVYGGGGNLVEGRNEARRFLERHHAAAEKLVVFPHTISGHEDLLGRLGANVDVFARENVSFEHVQRYAPGATHFLVDDLAFGLDVDAVLAADLSRPFAGIPLKRLVRREAALLRAALRRRTGPERILNCFRTDGEQTDIRRPSGNMDLSKLFKYGSASLPERSLRASSMILQMLSLYDEVRTNRLHLAVAGALLGKKVQFHPNSYFKCEAVYRYSMKDRFPTVQWMGDLAD